MASYDYDIGVIGGGAAGNNDRAGGRPNRHGDGPGFSEAGHPGAGHPYPTLAEINKKVAGTFLSTKIFSEPVKKGLKFFFRLKGSGKTPCSPITK